jgi:oxygen-independent coproporphyrinogen-3 oxidase
MAGIYVHIPFCRRACHYCDFHFTTNLKNSIELVDAILKEIEIRKDYLENEPIKTIYFGGGTPSLLPTTEIARVLESIRALQNVNSEIELTLEANPEDLSAEKLKELRSIGVNRLSLGTQSFIDAELKWMNRMHTADQAKRVIRSAQELGYDNISIDLIFGLPDQTTDQWQFNIIEALKLDVQHISSYGLTVEPKTVLSNRIKKGTQKPPEDTIAATSFQMNMQQLPAAGFEHYEISNFAKNGFISQHNSSYWLGEKYLGIGPSAHSYNGTQRLWNIRSNAAYITRTKLGRDFNETETLSKTDRLNEEIMIGLRTKWGIQRSNLDLIDTEAWNHLLISAHLQPSDNLEITEDRIRLTQSGKMKADLLASELFFD